MDIETALIFKEIVIIIETIEIFIVFKFIKL